MWVAWRGEGSCPSQDPNSTHPACSHSLYWLCKGTQNGDSVAACSSWGPDESRAWCAQTTGVSVDFWWSLVCSYCILVQKWGSGLMFLLHFCAEMGIRFNVLDLHFCAEIGIRFNVLVCCSFASHWTTPVLSVYTLVLIAWIWVAHCFPCLKSLWKSYSAKCGLCRT
jgi:hypothetical protein